MAGFQVPQYILVVEAILLIYFVCLGIVLSMLPLNNVVNAPYVNELGEWSYTPQTTDTFQVNYSIGNPNNTMDLYTPNDNWKMDTIHGLYPISHTFFNCLINNNPSAEIKIGYVQYDSTNNIISNTLVTNNLNLNETDFVFLMDNRLILSNTFYSLSFLNGVPCIAVYNVVTLVQGGTYIIPLSNSNSISSGINTIEYTLNLNNGIFTLYDNGNIFGQVTLTNLIGYNMGYSDTRLNVFTDNIDYSGNANCLNILSDGTSHSLTTNTNANSYTSQVQLLFDVLVLNIPQIPTAINIVFIKIPLLIFVLILLLIAYAVLVALIP